METEETSRSGRVRKKSSKLLSIEQDSIKEQQLALESVQKVVSRTSSYSVLTSINCFMIVIELINTAGSHAVRL